MPSLTNTELLSLEEEIHRALETGDESSLTILGYGEISVVFRIDVKSGSFACKRLPAFDCRRDARAYASLVNEYIVGLTNAGLDVAPTDVQRIERHDGKCILFCVQPVINADALGPRSFRTLSAQDAGEAFLRIADRLERSVSSTLAPDGQLSNWAFTNETLLYLDITTPLLRDESGQSRVDWTPLLRNLPAPFRPYIRRRIPHITSFYHSLRGQLLDFLANLRKEKLDHLYPALIPMTAERFGFDPPITLDAIRKYYAANARDYVLLEQAKRADRWFHRHILRRTYPNLLAPVIERNPF